MLLMQVRSDEFACLHEAFRRRQGVRSKEPGGFIFFRLIKNAQMQVEPCEIPFAGAPEVLRSEAYLNVRCNDEGRGERRKWVFFNSL